MRNSVDLQEKRKLSEELSQVRAAKARFEFYQKSARRIRTLERGAWNHKFIAPFQYGILYKNKYESNVGYRALLDGFLAKGFLTKDDGTVVKLTDEQKAKLRTAGIKVAELVDHSLNYSGSTFASAAEDAKKIVKEFQDQRQYSLTNHGNGKKYKSRALDFFSWGHRMIAEIREYEDGTRTVALMNGGKFSRVNPTDSNTVAVVSEREIKEDEDLEKLVGQILISGALQRDDIDIIERRPQCGAEYGPKQVHGNCITNAITIMINHYLHDDDLSKGLKNFVTQFRSEQVIKDLRSREDDLSAMLAALGGYDHSDNSEENKEANRKAERARIAEERRMIGEIMKAENKKRRQFFYEDIYKSEYEGSVINYLSEAEDKKDEQFNPSIIRFESILRSHKDKAIPPIYRGCGFRYDIIANLQSGGVSSIRINEIFSPEFSRFSQGGKKLDAAAARQNLEGLLITQITTKDPADSSKNIVIDIATLFQPPKPRDVAEKELSAILHNDGEISFKALDEVSFSCQRTRENIFVPRECNNRNVQEFYERNLSSGVQYDPQEHGVSFSEKTKADITYNPKNPSSVVVPHVSTSRSPIFTSANSRGDVSASGA
jgi:hypothetical protein